MLSIALTRLRSRLGLTLLSLTGVALAVALVVSIPVFSRGISFVMLQEELGAAGRNMIADKDPRPPYSIRFRVQPRGQYELPLEHTATLETFVGDTIATQTGLPLLGVHRQMETQGLLVRQQVESPEGKPRFQTVFQDTQIIVIPEVEPHLIAVDGKPMSQGEPGSPVEIWIHHSSAKYGVDDGQLGLRPGVQYQIYDARTKLEIPIEVVGTWTAANPLDTFWPGDPEHDLRKAMLIREGVYRATIEPLFERQLRSASWHVVLDHDRLTPQNMHRHAEGLRSAKRDVEMRLGTGSTASAPKTDSPLLDALDAALKREYDLTVLMFALSVPIIAFLLYFMSLISSIAIRWQQRETAIMVSRGMRRGQLLRVTLIEALVLLTIGVPLGILLGLQMAQAMGYTASFLRFTWRPPLPVSPSSANVPLLVAALSALLIARIWPLVRSSGTSVVAHEHGRARAARKPLWQRFGLDFLLLVPVVYAIRQLRQTGTLIPSFGPEQAAESITRPIRAPTLQNASSLLGSDTAFQSSPRDPLLFLAPALFALVLALLLVRLFPLLMRIGDGLSALGRRPALYLAFRQLSRQSGQYASALLLVISALALGSFMASLAASMDDWLVDQVYYDVGSDVLIRQTYNPVYLMDAIVPKDGAWMLPPSVYHTIPGVQHAARAGLYPASIYMSNYEAIRGTYIGVDRLDLPQTLAFRPDFASEPLGTLMNRLAAHDNGVLVSEQFLRENRLEVGDTIPTVVTLVDLFDEETSVRTDFLVVGTFRYFPTLYERHDQKTAVVGNLDYLYGQVGGPELHHIWLKTEPDADKRVLQQEVAALKVYVREWRDARETLTTELAQPERVGTLGTLAIGFLAAATFSGIGLLIYNYASLQERLFRFSILRAVGLTRRQIVVQVAIEYTLVMAYGVVGGTGIGVWAALWFVPYFQATEGGALRPPPMIPAIAWEEIGLICASFAGVLILAQITLLLSALRKGVFQSLRLGDRE